MRPIFGAPRKYEGLARNLIRLPRSQRSTAYGPEPIGIDSKRAVVKSVTPRNACSGTIEPSWPPTKSSEVASAHAERKCRTTVRSFGVSMRSTIEYTDASGKFVFGSRIKPKVNATSRAVSGTPSCQRTPLRIFEYRVDQLGGEDPGQQGTDGTSRAVNAEGIERIVVTQAALDFKDHE